MWEWFKREKLNCNNVKKSDANFNDPLNKIYVILEKLKNLVGVIIL